MNHLKFNQRRFKWVLGMKLLVVVNNISSPQKLMDLAKTVYTLSDDVLIITRATGMAAQVGVPEVSKYAYKLKRSVIVMPNLQDLIEIIKPSKTLLLVPEDFEGARDLCELVTDNSAIVISGNEDGFSRNELGIGDKVFIKDVKEYLPPSAFAAALYTYLRFKCGVK